MLILAARPDDIGASSLLELEGLLDPLEFLLGFAWTSSVWDPWALFMLILAAMPDDIGTSSLLQLVDRRDPRELL